MSAHIYHHADLDSVVTGVVIPATRLLREIPGVLSWFFLRHWQGGPHIRLRIACSTSLASEQARDQISRTASAWREQLDPAPELSAAAYQARASALLAIEPGHATAEPLSPTGTIQFRDFRGDWGPHLPPLAETPDVTAFLQASSEVACELVPTMTDKQRILHAVQAYCQAPLGPCAEEATADRASDIRSVRDSWGNLITGGDMPALDAWAVAVLTRQPASWRKLAAGRDSCLSRLVSAMNLLVPGSPRPLLVHALHTHLNRVGLTLRAEAAALALSLRILESEITS